MVAITVRAFAGMMDVRVRMDPSLVDDLLDRFAGIVDGALDFVEEEGHGGCYEVDNLCPATQRHDFGGVVEKGGVGRELGTVRDS